MKRVFLGGKIGRFKKFQELGDLWGANHRAAKLAAAGGIHSQNKGAARGNTLIKERGLGAAEGIYSQNKGKEQTHLEREEEGQGGQKKKGEKRGDLTSHGVCALKPLQ